MSRSTFIVDPAYQPAMREIGLDADAVFTHPQIKVWRSITERENCTLDATLADGTAVRWHVKRYRRGANGTSPAKQELEGVRLLEASAIPTVKVVGHGDVPDGRSFIIVEDLAGYAAADKLIESGRATFETLCAATADLAGALHDRALHHRDLYLCHFFAKVDDDGKVDVRLIDAGRVAPLPRWPFRGRWIVKDLSQFWYSAEQLGVPEPQRRTWLERYAERRGLPASAPLRHAIERKAKWIARHDARSRAKQPTRNVSIPAPAPSPTRGEGTGQRGMNIALVILHADPARGGAERYTIDLAAALVRRGHAVSLLASSHAASLPGVKNVRIEAPGVTRAGRYRGFLASLDADLAASSYDVVHAMLPVNRCDVYHPHAGIAVSAERKWNVHLNPRRKRMATVERALLTGPNAPITIALSEYVKRDILRYYALPAERLATLFNAVDLKRFEPAPLPQHDYINGLFIGHDWARKGLGPTLLATSMLKEPRLKITVIGKRAGLRPPPDAAAQFSFAGEVGDPRPFYADADFFVLPTMHDPCSLVVLEALAMGLPVISTVFNGATEVMTDGVHGYVLTNPTDVNALAEAMRKMLDPTRREAMREACLDLRPQLSYEHHLDELIKIYQRATARR